MKQNKINKMIAGLVYIATTPFTSPILGSILFLCGVDVLHLFFIPIEQNTQLYKLKVVVLSKFHSQRLFL
jgi:hypothetical protein